MRKLVLYACVAFSSGLLFTNLYNSIVNAANWESNIPRSITATREFFVVANPGTFFKIIDPTNLILHLLALILFWRISKSVRLYLGIAILCSIGSMILTFSFFYPRNEIMFLAAQLPDAATLKEVAAEWGWMNWVRSCIMLAVLVCSFLALDKAGAGGRQGA